MKTLIFVVSLISVSIAQAATSFTVTLTNGSGMPISPGVVFVSKMQTPLSRLGSAATAGFVQLCQTGNPNARINELKSNPSASSVVGTIDPILPGQSKSVVVSVANTKLQSIQVEAMYGKTKDVCTVASVGSHSLTALLQHITPLVLQPDQAIATGAFTDPKVEEGACASSQNAVGCLRELSQPAFGKIRAFSGYLPSVVSFIEEKFGTGETQSLLIPDSGAVQVTVKLNH